MGRRVEITGTSRADLNGKRGTAISFDTDKGRYRVRVRGSDMYLKPSNLLPVPETGTPSSFADVKDQAEQYADEFMSRLKDALPPGFAPRDALFAIEPVQWDRVGCYQEVAIRAIAEEAIGPSARGHTCTLEQLSSQRPNALPDKLPGAHHLYVSSDNAGALELIQEARARFGEVDRELNGFFSKTAQSSLRPYHEGEGHRSHRSAFNAATTAAVLCPL